MPQESLKHYTSGKKNPLRFRRCRIYFLLLSEIVFIGAFTVTYHSQTLARWI